MYNEQWKMSFVNLYADQARTHLINLFEKFAPYEEEWGDDLCRQPTDRLQTVVDKLVDTEKYSFRNVVERLRQYFAWCETNKVKVSDAVLFLKPKPRMQYSKGLVASPLHLKTIMDQTFRPLKYQTIDVTFRVYLWLAFSGMIDTDAINVSVKNVDLSNLCILYKGMKYPIYESALDDFKQACELQAFRYQEQLRPREESDKLLRGFRVRRDPLKEMRTAISRNFQKQDNATDDSDSKRLNYASVYSSGLYFRLYQAEQSGEKIVYRDVAENELIKKGEKKPTASKSKAEWDNKTNYNAWYLKRNYQTWKAVYTG